MSPLHRFDLQSYDTKLLENLPIAASLTAVLLAQRQENQISDEATFSRRLNEGCGVNSETTTTGGLEDLPIAFFEPQWIPEVVPGKEVINMASLDICR